MSNNRMIFDFLSHLPRDAEKKDIERTYKALALIYHPDKNPGRKEWAEEKLKQLNEAKELLLDPSKRQYYLNLLAQHKKNTVVQQHRSRALEAKLQQSQRTNGVLGLSLLLLGISLLEEK